MQMELSNKAIVDEHDMTAHRSLPEHTASTLRTETVVMAKSVSTSQREYESLDSTGKMLPNSTYDFCNEYTKEPEDSKVVTVFVQNPR